MNRFWEFLCRFFEGRYGIDNLNKLILYLYIVLAVINSFIKTLIISSVCTVLAVLLIYRMLSRNIYARQWENAKYLNLRDKLIKKIIYIKNKWKYRRTHIYRKCPHCKAKVRLPRRKGGHICCCPACKKDFKVKCRW